MRRDATLPSNSFVRMIAMRKATACAVSFDARPSCGRPLAPEHSDCVCPACAKIAESHENLWQWSFEAVLLSLCVWCRRHGPRFAYQRIVVNAMVLFMMSFRKTLLAVAAISCLLAISVVDAIQVDDEFPKDVELHYGFPPERINISKRIQNKKVLVVGLPGAFTPT